MWLLVTRGPFRIVERIFLAICLIQVTYVIAAFKAVDAPHSGVSWPHILQQTVTPNFSGDSAFLLLCVGVVGTTIAPWMQFFLQSNMVDRGIRVAGYRYQKADVYLGAFVTDLVGWFIIVCTAATLYPLVQAGKLKVESTEQIAQALAIPLGHIGTTLFAVGLARRLAFGRRRVAARDGLHLVRSVRLGNRFAKNQQTGAALLRHLFGNFVHRRRHGFAARHFAAFGDADFAKPQRHAAARGADFHAQISQRQAPDERLRQRFLGQLGRLDDGDNFNYVTLILLITSVLGIG